MNNQDKDRTAMKAVVEVCRAMHAAIKDAGPNGLPSGELYAVVAAGLQLQSQDAYDKLVDLLVRSGSVKRTNDHRLVAL